MARPSIGWNMSPTNSTVASENVLTEGIKDGRHHHGSQQWSMRGDRASTG